MPKISVVIPVYNKEYYLKNTINSVLQQGFSDFELILIDDGSTDNSKEIIEHFTDDRIRFYHQENQGVSKTRNRGVALAKSPLIAFLDADDYWYPNHLQEIFDLYRRFPQADFYATAYRIKYNDRLQKDFVFNFDDDKVLLNRFYQYLKGAFLFYTSNFAIKKEVFLAEKGFRDDIDSEDTELFLRLGIKYPVAYSNQITLLHIDAAKNSLFKTTIPQKRSLLLNSFVEAEKKDADLKRYLDLNRFAWILQYLLNGEKQSAKQLMEQIDIKNLNGKQKILLRLPCPVLRVLLKIKKVLQKAGIYTKIYD